MDLPVLHEHVFKKPETFQPAFRASNLLKLCQVLEVLSSGLCLSKLRFVIAEPKIIFFLSHLGFD